MTAIEQDRLINEQGNKLDDHESRLAKMETRLDIFQWVIYSIGGVGIGTIVAAIFKLILK